MHLGLLRLWEIDSICFDVCCNVYPEILCQKKNVLNEQFASIAVNFSRFFYFRYLDEILSIVSLCPNKPFFIIDFSNLSFIAQRAVLFRPN